MGHQLWQKELIFRGGRRRKVGFFGGLELAGLFSDNSETKGADFSPHSPPSRLCAFPFFISTQTLLSSLVKHFNPLGRL